MVEKSGSRIAALLAVFAGFVVYGADAGAAGPESRCEGLVCIDLFEVGDVRNPPDAESGHGRVDHSFAVTRGEITLEQYVTFLNAVAADLSMLAPTQRETIEALWQEDMFKTYDYVSPHGAISRSGSGTGTDPYIYREAPDLALGAHSVLRPALYISWFSAARFANWLHNGGKNGSDTETGAYSLEYRQNGIAARNPDARWWIPSADEWYKAAFYDPTKPGGNPYWLYPTRSDELPVAEMPPGGANSANYNSMAPDGRKLTAVGSFAGTASHYGAQDLAGSMWEWTDTPVLNHDGEPETMIVMGGSWSLGLINVSKFGARDYLPSSSDDDTGFRLATTTKSSK